MDRPATHLEQRSTTSRTVVALVCVVAAVALSLSVAAVEQHRRAVTATDRLSALVHARALAVGANLVLVDEQADGATTRALVPADLAGQARRAESSKGRAKVSFTPSRQGVSVRQGGARACVRLVDGRAVAATGPCPRTGR